MVKEKADGARRRLQGAGEPQDGSRNPYWCTGTLYCILTEVLAFYSSQIRDMQRKAFKVYVSSSCQ